MSSGKFDLSSSLDGENLHIGDQKAICNLSGYSSEHIFIICERLYVLVSRFWIVGVEVQWLIL